MHSQIYMYIWDRLKSTDLSRMDIDTLKYKFEKKLKCLGGVDNTFQTTYKEEAIGGKGIVCRILNFRLQAFKTCITEGPIERLWDEIST